VPAPVRKSPWVECVSPHGMKYYQHTETKVRLVFLCVGQVVCQLCRVCTEAEREGEVESERGRAREREGAREGGRESVCGVKVCACRYCKYGYIYIYIYVCVCERRVGFLSTHSPRKSPGSDP
jgi:hypothetical protein